MTEQHDKDLAFMKAIAKYALENGVTTLDAQRVFGHFARHAASKIAALEGKSEREVLNLYVAAYAEGIGATGAAIVSGPPSGGIKH